MENKKELKTKVKKFYITAAIPYVNADPHIGHALEFVQTDTIARYHKLLGEDVKTTSGGDENALKNVQAAEEGGAPVQEFVDTNTEKFRQLAIKLNVQFDVWQKGSDRKIHYPASQKLWELCEKNGDIYKKKYVGLYCVGCELFYSPDELDEKGECFEHPGKKLQEVSEENYFFKLSKYQDTLIELIESGNLEIIPEKRKNETLSFLRSGLQDISISRTNERAKNWGVPVPNDPEQRMYVWFDALNIYQSGIGFGWDEKTYEKYWPADVHAIGKGILRFHAIYWPAFLLSAKLKTPKAIFVHDYFTVNDQKMSKTVGNVVDPMDLVKKYGADALRYYFLAKFSPFTDGDFSDKKLQTAYNSDLANGIGNLVARVAKLCEISEGNFKTTGNYSLDKDVEKYLKEYRFDYALRRLWEIISETDKYLHATKPWEKKGDEQIKILEKAVENVRNIAYNLKPFLPEAASKIEKQFSEEKIKAGESLFPRLL